MVTDYRSLIGVLDILYQADFFSPIHGIIVNAKILYCDRIIKVALRKSKIIFMILEVFTYRANPVVDKR